MNDTPRQRRSLLVVLLDATLRLAAAVQAGPSPQPRVRTARSSPRAGRVLLAVGTLTAVGGTALLIIFFVRTPAGLALLPGPAPVAPGATTSSGAPSTGASPGLHPSARVLPGTSRAPSVTATPSPTTPPAPSQGANSEVAAVPLTARYTTVPQVAGLLGYRVTVVVTNPGAAPRDGWLLTMTLPRPTLMVSQVSGATATQNGAVWTFIPDASTAHVAPRGSAQVAFEVYGATLVNATPVDCRIDGNRCG
jgi:Cellulose binding domain